ncbi:hypothetical protein Cadr_000031020 [Camelus dromedarius]|uniref:Uncharacterized protein n=1 Tax=Camelus dromedarius TaxID=9838 RepID=A0A5N4C0Y9_CAMDR|nr:hypothetical protein Cadr_000031020 [Camelus dromedarius]
MQPREGDPDNTYLVPPRDLVPQVKARSTCGGYGGLATLNTPQPSVKLRGPLASCPSPNFLLHTGAHHLQHFADCRAPDLQWSQLSWRQGALGCGRNGVKIQARIWGTWGLGRAEGQPFTPRCEPRGSNTEKTGAMVGTLLENSKTEATLGILLSLQGCNPREGEAETCLWTQDLADLKGAQGEDPGGSSTPLCAPFRESHVKVGRPLLVNQVAPRQPTQELNSRASAPGQGYSLSCSWNSPLHRAVQSGMETVLGQSLHRFLRSGSIPILVVLCTGLRGQGGSPTLVLACEHGLKVRDADLPWHSPMHRALRSGMQPYPVTVRDEALSWYWPMHSAMNPHLILALHMALRSGCSPILGQTSAEGLAVCRTHLFRSAGFLEAWAVSGGSCQGRRRGLPCGFAPISPAAWTWGGLCCPRSPAPERQTQCSHDSRKWEQISALAWDSPNPTLASTASPDHTLPASLRSRLREDSPHPPPPLPLPAVHPRVGSHTLLPRLAWQHHQPPRPTDDPYEAWELPWDKVSGQESEPPPSPAYHAQEPMTQGRVPAQCMEFVSGSCRHGDRSPDRPALASWRRGVLGVWEIPRGPLGVEVTQLRRGRAPSLDGGGTWGEHSGISVVCGGCKLGPRLRCEKEPCLGGRMRDQAWPGVGKQGSGDRGCVLVRAVVVLGGGSRDWFPTQLGQQGGPAPTPPSPAPPPPHPSAPLTAYGTSEEGRARIRERAQSDGKLGESREPLDQFPQEEHSLGSGSPRAVASAVAARQVRGAGRGAQAWAALGRRTGRGRRLGRSGLPPWFVVPSHPTLVVLERCLRYRSYTGLGKREQPWEVRGSTSDRPSGHGLVAGGGSGCGRMGAAPCEPLGLFPIPLSPGLGQPAPRSRTRCSQGLGAVLSAAAAGRGVCPWEPVHLLPSPPWLVLGSVSAAPRLRDSGYRSVCYPEAGPVRSVQGRLRNGNKSPRSHGAARIPPSPPPSPDSTASAFQEQADLPNPGQIAGEFEANPQAHLGRPLTPTPWETADLGMCLGRWGQIYQLTRGSAPLPAVAPGSQNACFQVSWLLGGGRSWVRGQRQQPVRSLGGLGSGPLS